MNYYLFILAALSLIGLQEIVFITKDISVRKLSVSISFVLLSFFMCFRHYLIGIDTRQYYIAFLQIKDFTLKELFTRPVYGFGGGYTTSLEPGYKILCKVTSFFSSSGQAIIISSSLLIMIFLFMFIIAKSPYPMLSIWLYFTLGTFQTHMNVSRNAIAIFIAYVSFQFIQKKQLCKFVVLILIASSFHFSALVFLPMYWIINGVPLKWFSVQKIIVLAIIVFFASQVIITTISNFIPLKYRGYLANTNSDITGMSIGVIYLMLFLLIHVTTKEKRLSDTDNGVGAWMFIIAILVYAIGGKLAAFNRLAALFGPYSIVYFPQIIRESKISYSKKLFLIIAIAIVSGAIYIVRININNIGGTIPFKFFW